MNKKLSLSVIVVLALALWWIGVSAEQGVIAIKAGKILTITAGVIEDGIILIDKGKIIEVGKELPIPPQATLIDASTSTVMPGMIEAHTTIGLRERFEPPGADETTDPCTPQLKVLDALNPFSKDIKEVLFGGITAALITPGRLNVIGGQPAVVKLTGTTISQMVLLEPAGVKISLGEGPKDAYGAKRKLPSTRMGSAYLVRKSLTDADYYLNQWKEYENKKATDKEAKKPKLDLKLEPLAKLLEGKLTAFIECYRTDDIMTALRIIDEFKLKAVLVGCADGHKVADEIARRKVPVILSPMGTGPRRIETKDVTISNAAVLSRAGVKVVIHSDASLGVGAIRELPLAAAFAVKGGMDRDEALKAITINAAEILGVADRIGSIEKGKDADLVILSGDPFHYLTRVEKVFINGETAFEKKEQN